MKVTIAVSLVNSTGGANIVRVDAPFDEWVNDPEKVKEDAAAVAVQELTARDRRNDKVRTWTVDGAKRV